MKTRCPYCQTTFKVTPELLAVAAGNVRCGQCEHIFNGNDYLQKDELASAAVNKNADKFIAPTANNADIADDLDELATAFGSLETSLADFENSLDNLEKNDPFLNAPATTEPAAEPEEPAAEPITAQPAEPAVEQPAEPTPTAPTPLHVAPVTVKKSAKTKPASANSSEAASSPIYDFSRFDKPVPKPVAAPEPERQATAADILHAQHEQLLNKQRQPTSAANQVASDVELPPISLDDEEEIAVQAPVKTATGKPQNRSIDDLIKSYMGDAPKQPSTPSEDDLDFGQLFDSEKISADIAAQELAPSIGKAPARADKKSRKTGKKTIELSLLGSKNPETPAAPEIERELLARVGSGDILAQSPLANRRQQAAKSNKIWLLIAIVLTLSLILQIAYVMRYQLVQSELGLKIISGCAQFRVCQLKNLEAYELLSRQLKSSAHNKQVLNLKVVFRNNAKYAQRPPTMVISMSDRNGVQIGYYAFKPADYWQKPLIAPQESVNLSVDFADIRKKSLGFEVSLI